jgi:UDP-N-acetylglucosamine enolpyruvyl transferase
VGDTRAGHLRAGKPAAFDYPGYGQPYPDYQSPTLAGTVLFHDWMYESRFFFTDKLIRMGARITLCDPHRVVVQGPTALAGLPNITSPDIRAGMAILLAALAARGETHIYNVQQIDRGYERVDEKLRALGANIRRIDTEDTTSLDETMDTKTAQH